MGDTNIEWATKVWNFVRGCRRVSPGCEHCYAEDVAGVRHSGPGRAYEGLAVMGKNGPRWTGKGRFVASKLAEPLSWRPPADGGRHRVFVNSMSDLFFEEFSNKEIAAGFGVMAASPQHDFLILTKRAERMRDWFAWAAKRGEQGASLFPDDPLDWRIRQMVHVEARRAGADLNADKRQNHGGPWPLPNVWLGVSAEDQQRAEERIPLLLQTPAAVRFVSAEPLLAPVDFEEWLSPLGAETCSYGGAHEAKACECRQAAISWVIVGGESGRGARSMDIAWARALRDQCAEAKVPLFFKQAGAEPIDSSLRDVWCNGEHHYTRAPDDEVVRQAERTPGYTVTPHQLGRLLRDRKGGDLAELPENLRVREFPEARR